MNAHDTERMSRRSQKVNTLTLQYNAQILDALHKDEEQRDNDQQESWYSLSLSADGWFTMQGHDLMTAEAEIAMQDPLFRKKVREIMVNAQRLLDDHAKVGPDTQTAITTLLEG